MNRNLLLAALALGAPLCAVAATPSLTDLSGSGLNPQALSPSGRYLAGCRAGYGNDAVYAGFRHDLSTAQTSWLTSYSEDAPAASGSFLAVNDAGDLAGYFKDPDNVLEIYDEYFDETTRTPLGVAAVWKGGQCSSLGLCGKVPSDFEDENDGTRAAALSADGRTAAGYMVHTWMPSKPAGWRLNDAGVWESVEYAMPQDGTVGAIYALSADGKTAGGQVSIAGADGPCYLPVIWTSPQECVVLQPDKVTASTSGNVVAISPGGRYALVSFDPLRAAVYDIQTADMRYLPVAREVTSLKPHAIADDGNAVLTAVMGDYSTVVAQYYDYAAGAAFDMDYYARFHAAGVQVPARFRSLSRYLMSADGTLIVGADGQGAVYALQLDGEARTLPQGVGSLHAYTSAPDQITLSWEAAAPQAGDAPLSGYRVNFDGNPVATISDLSYVIDSVEKGPHSVSVTALYGDVAAPEAEKTLYVNPQSIPFFENFDASLAGIDETLWDRDYELGNVEEWIAWSAWPQEYNNITPHIVAAVTATQPYRAVLSSQFMTRAQSAEAKDARLSCIVMGTPINSNDQDFSGENLLLQISTDGLTWTTLQTINAGSLVKYAWTPVNIDLGAGTGPFKVRLSAEGEGRAAIMWRVDNISITDAAPVAAPQGLRGTALDDGTVRLDWLDHHATTPVSYLGNLHTITDQCVGNDGSGLIAAVLLTADKMAPMAGQYISSVSAYIYDGVPQYAATDVPTSADLVIWEDGVKIADQHIDARFDTRALTRVKLQTPVQIKAGAAYRVGVRIVEGRSSQNGTPYYFTPMYYSNLAPLSGITDLYSEDEGETWKLLADAYDPDDARFDAYRDCVWDIVANVTSTPETEIMETPALFGYEVLRQGAPLPGGMVYPYTPTYIDAKPLETGTYAVRAYYENGDVSEPSEAVTVKALSVESVQADGALRVWPNPCRDILSIDGGTGAIRIYDMAGRLALSADAGALDVSTLPAGLYLLQRGAATVKFVKL